MFKIRKTTYNILFPENSPEVYYLQDEKSFYNDIQKLHCYYDEFMNLYYTPDNKISFEIIENK